ncbi:hypothetical protein TD95_004143 [Thielaviopsis punctulata]|uniref:ATPase synthesis protein 25 n=1 Tax=Thielaviopsis punctulata TaxID=72032 RepID=A0A0F4ZEQ4_9PEZI|nr:hypothetical protein TD95_004143 [Thielaviopsis punctulata]
MLSRSALRIARSAGPHQLAAVGNVSARPLQRALLGPMLSWAGSSPAHIRAFSDSAPPSSSVSTETVTEAIDEQGKEGEEAVEATQESETDIEMELMAEDGENVPSNPDMPWYLQVDPPLQTPTHLGSAPPSPPTDSPAILEPLIKYAFEDMGLDDMTILDLRTFDPPPALGPNLIMLFGTARSERHLHVASARLVRWLRYNYHMEAAADGLIGAGELRTKLRRLRRKAKIMGSGTVLHRGGDDGISTGWICVNLGTVGNTVSEELRVDDAGKMSGFGGSTDGTTIVLQVMTESRRAELDLEGLWTRSLEGNRKMREKLMAPLDENYKPAMPNNWDKKLRRKRKRQQQHEHKAQNHSAKE